MLERLIEKFQSPDPTDMEIDLFVCECHVSGIFVILDYDEIYSLLKMPLTTSMSPTA